MGVVHFLNVREGDCSIIQHTSGRITVIDICNGNSPTPVETGLFEHVYDTILGNYHQKEYPVNPITYLKLMGVENIWRFILTHPDMDHMDGLNQLCNEFKVYNFWDTGNKKKMGAFDGSRYKKEDWYRYQEVRKKALFLYDGAIGRFYNCDNEQKTGNGDYLQILCPTKKLVDEANENDNYNNASYVILYNENGRKILFSGDAEEREWDVLLDKYKDLLRNIDVLISPHHGRKSGGNDMFLDILRPKLTLFGNAKSKDLNYSAWYNRGLRVYTNNQGGSFVLVHRDNWIDLYCTYENFAKRVNSLSKYNRNYRAWFMGSF